METSCIGYDLTNVTIFIIKYVNALCLNNKAFKYYPNLSAKQLKQVILASATPLTGTMVLKPGSKTDKVDFTTLCKTGGIVNAYKAVQLASKLKGEHK